MHPLTVFHTAEAHQPTGPNVSWSVSEHAHPFSSNGLKAIIEAADQPYFLLCTSPWLPEPGAFALERMVQVAEDTGAVLLYSDYNTQLDNTLRPNPLNDYQSGSLRDDFDFGPLLLIHTATAKALQPRLLSDLQAAALYDFRLTLSRSGPLVHLDERLYTYAEQRIEHQESRQFAYVDPKNREVQQEMEAVCTRHLKEIGAWLPPMADCPDLEAGVFPVEASVIIPVKNRIRTIADAIDSVLKQETAFPFNLIIIDNHSTDGTTALIEAKAKADARIVHLIPDRNDLGIGGCWQAGIHHQACGRFAVQLDSDDVYSDTHSLAAIVEGFYTQRCAMLVGSYRMCNFQLETIPPGIIDHREWTPENGHNNALRINGLGAPRAFHTPSLRAIGIPNTSYGEDYALGLRLSRRWKIGRLYDVLYLCRRWEDNTDAVVDLPKLNAFNHYKDQLRTIELAARQRMNAANEEE
ncbi:MAG: glycosyltransferase family 2 protein [Bacteroidales bacterium]|nr:glycosyltransferase family 2 protein [Bacteroidales bacterium]